MARDLERRRHIYLSMTRVFIAVEIPMEIKEKISGIGDILSKTEAKLNIVNPEISHITLKFIGDTDDKTLEEIKSFLSGIKYNQFNINLNGVYFNNPKSPRVIWIKGYDNGNSSELAGVIEEGLVSLGIPKEERDFKIHATIARIKRYHPALKPVVKSLKDENIGSFRVNGFKLKKSTLTPQGPVYEDIMEVSF